MDHFIGYLSSDLTAPAVPDKIVLTALNDCGYCKSDYCGIKNDPNVCTKLFRHGSEIIISDCAVGSTSQYTATSQILLKIGSNICRSSPNYN